MYDYNITIGNGQKFHGRGWFFEEVLWRCAPGDIKIKDLYPIRVFIHPTEPITKEVNSE